MEKKARVIAFYLPQFHPIPENDETWGKGFTEWTNVVQAKPLYKGHYQPRVPTDLGFYDLRLPVIREQQAEMAREAGVEGFMYWHYWFGEGKMVLEKPLEEVIDSGKPDFPFCYGWANHSWSTKTWKKGGVLQSDKMIAEQKYLGEEDNKLHYTYCRKAFHDARYIKVEGKPLFIIYDPLNFVGLNEFISQWRMLAEQDGLKGIFFVGLWGYEKQTYEDMMSMGLDGVIRSGRHIAEKKVTGNILIKKLKGAASKYFGMFTNKYEYEDIMNVMFFDENKIENCYPIISPGYDRTARAGKQARVYSNPNPTSFKKHVAKTLQYIENKEDEHKLIFLDSWNEWAEGNYMEPDTKWGHGFLNALKEVITK